MADPSSTGPFEPPALRERRRHALERSASGGAMLRLDDVLIVRGTYGSWLMDLNVDVGADHVRLQVPIGRHKALDRLATELKRAEMEGR